MQNNINIINIILKKKLYFWIITSDYQRKVAPKPPINYPFLYCEGVWIFRTNGTKTLD